MKLLAVLAAAALASSCAGAPPTTAPSPDQPPAEGPAEGGEDSSQFVVSQEVYTRTFEEIGEFIDNLNLIIRNADYESWLTFLSEEYIRVTADPAYLKDQSEKPLLKQANRRLADLRDYFAHVVVPSRTQATVDEIEFLDENHVKAIAVLRGTRVILYLLERHDSQWKIGVW
jgi:hypothetical protein